MSFSIYFFCGKVWLIMIISLSKPFSSFTYKDDMIHTCFFLLIICGIGGKELKFINKYISFRIDRALFKIGGKNLNLSKLKR